jgi:hypothetical protein
MHKIAIGVLTWRATEVPIFKRFLRMLPAVCLAMGMARAAENPFIGEWKLDPSKSRLPDEMKVESEGGNKYTFDFGAGTERIVVDGTDQPGNGGTLLSVNAEASDTWIVERKKDGRLLIRATWNISKDGRTLTDYFRGFQSDGSTLSMDYVYQRIGGGSGFAADWRSIKETINSPYSIRVKEYQRDGLSLITPSQTKNVKFDGEDYPNEGPNAQRGASASIRRVDERALVLTDKINGKVVDIEAIGVSPDLKTLTITVQIPDRDNPNVMVFERK